MSGLCFIAYSLEQHDQASTKGAFVIRRAKNVMGHGDTGRFFRQRCTVTGHGRCRGHLFCIVFGHFGIS